MSYQCGESTKVNGVLNRKEGAKIYNWTPKLRHVSQNYHSFPVTQCTCIFWGKALVSASTRPCKACIFFICKKAKCIWGHALGCIALRDGLAPVPWFKHAPGPWILVQSPAENGQNGPALGCLQCLESSWMSCHGCKTKTLTMANHSCLLQPSPCQGGIHPTASRWSAARECTARRLVQIISNVFLSLPS